MNNKYYTPTIEEFHIGFEFQKWEVHDLYYQTLIMQDTTNLTFIKERLQEIRVKYLDDEDIESLGFNSFELLYGTKRYWAKEGNLVIYKYDDGKYGIYNSIDFKDLSKDEDLFLGIIKNKSELKVLLKQLNIS